MSVASTWRCRQIDARCSLGLLIPSSCAGPVHAPKHVVDHRIRRRNDLGRRVASASKDTVLPTSRGRSRAMWRSSKAFHIPRTVESAEAASSVLQARHSTEAESRAAAAPDDWHECSSSGFPPRCRVASRTQASISQRLVPFSSTCSRLTEVRPSLASRPSGVPFKSTRLTHTEVLTRPISIPAGCRSSP